MAGTRDGTPADALASAVVPRASGWSRFHFASFRFLMFVVLAVGVVGAGVAVSADPGGAIMAALQSISSAAGALIDAVRVWVLGLIPALGGAPSRTLALWLGLLAMLALLPLAIVVRGMRLAVGTQRLLRSVEEADVSDRTSVVTGFSKPRRAFLQRDGEGRDSFEIRGELTRIGRADGNELVVPVAGVAPYHAAITRTADWDLYLCDLTSGSRDAARVNGQRVGRHRLADGDVISFGRARFTYRTAAL